MHGRPSYRVHDTRNVFGCLLSSDLPDGSKYIKWLKSGQTFPILQVLNTQNGLNMDKRSPDYPLEVLQKDAVGIASHKINISINYEYSLEQSLKNFFRIAIS